MPKPVEQKIQEAILYLVIKDPLLQEFADFLVIKPNNNIPTAGVRMDHNYINMFYNEEWMDSLDKNEMRFIVSHELYHVILAHVFCNLKNHMIDNIAADIEINQRPFADPPLTMKEKLCTYDAYNLSNRETREFYYLKLLEQAKEQCKGCGQGKDGKPRNCEGKSGQQGKGGVPGDCEGGQVQKQSIDDHSKWSDTDPTVEQVWRGKVESIMEGLKMKGSVRGDVVEKILSKWKKHRDIMKMLKRVVGKSIANSVQESSYWKRRNKRFPMYAGSRDMYGPKFVVAVDTSGSMSTIELENAYGILRWIKRQGYDGKLIQCDAEVSDVSSLGRIKGEINLRGRGGTSSRPVFDYIENNNVKPDLLLFFSDMATDFPQNHPAYKTVWIKTGKDSYAQTPPFGKMIDG